ncbi:MAG: stage II sporulation protein E, partial [Oscillibacter sp.]|nr:stage II sporulation protein E [Oscillibacter sp.]
MTTIRIPKDARALRRGAMFLLSAVLTAALTPGGYAPFALGLLSAAGAGRDGAAALGGTVLGSFLFLDFAGALPHLAAAILIFTASSAFRGTPLLTTRRMSALLAAVLFAAVGGIYVVQSLSPWVDLPLCLAGTALTAASAYLFRPLVRREEGNHQDGVLLLLAAVLLAFREVEVLGFSVSRALLALLLLYTAYDRGVTVGAAAGLGLGLTVDLCCGAEVFTAAFGLGGLAAASQSGARRIRSSAAFFAACAAALLQSTDG